MKEAEFRRLITTVTPDAPERFTQRVDAALGRIVRQEEAQMKEAAKKTIRLGRRALTLALAAVMMLGAIALAATHWNIFDTLHWLGIQPPTADSVMQGKLCEDTVNGVKITVQEAGYDGRMLLLQYSYRFPGIDEQLGEVLGRKGVRFLTEEDEALFEQYGVGKWMDAFWINGQYMDIAGGSGGSVLPGQNPGEIVCTEYLRLDNIDVALNGVVEITLPIGERQSDAYRSSLFSSETQQYALPDKGAVTFTFDASDTLSRVVTLHPNVETVTDDVTVKATEAAFTPLLTYVTLDMTANPDALAAYKAEHGEGYCDENGSLLWPYTGIDAYGGWISSLTLVDGSGTPLFPDVIGCNGMGDHWAEFIYPYVDVEQLPESLWLAPTKDGAVDMAHAIRVK